MRHGSKESHQMCRDPALREMLEDSRNRISKDYYLLANECRVGRRALCLGAYYPIKSLEAYGFDQEPSIHRVNTFQEIGWPDPFPGQQAIYTTRYQEPVVRDADLQAYRAKATQHNRKSRCLEGMRAPRAANFAGRLAWRQVQPESGG